MCFALLRLWRLDRAGEAVAVLAPAAARFTQHERIRFELGRAYYQLDRLAEAEIELKRAPSMEEARKLLEKVQRQKER